MQPASSEKVMWHTERQKSQEMKPNANVIISPRLWANPQRRAKQFLKKTLCIKFGKAEYTQRAALQIRKRILVS